MGFFESWKNITGDVLDIATGGMWDDFTGTTGVEESNKANERIADKQMAFQERMSNTAHQREIVDLRAAGINPILSANSGASAPSGASATMLPAPATKDSILGLLNILMSLKTTSAQVAKTNADTAQTLATTPDPGIFKKLYGAQAQGAEWSAKSQELDLQKRKLMSKIWESINEGVQEPLDRAIKDTRRNQNLEYKGLDKLMKYIMMQIMSVQDQGVGY